MRVIFFFSVASLLLAVGASIAPQALGGIAISFFGDEVHVAYAVKNIAFFGSIVCATLAILVAVVHIREQVIQFFKCRSRDCRFGR
jgi:FtsH-binding integral membrane protein